MAASTGFDMNAYLERMRAEDEAEKARENAKAPGSSANPLPADPAREPHRTAAQAAAGALVWDRDGMPTAFSDDGFPWNPTACCGASAKGVEDGIACRGCYEDATEYGGVPRGPYTAFAPPKGTADA